MERLLVIFCLFALDKPTRTLMNRVAELLPAHLTVSFFSLSSQMTSTLKNIRVPDVFFSEFMSF